jgi:hypothetical protein
MAYISPNLKNKAAIKRALAAGDTITVVSNSPMETIPTDGRVTIEGPHYPAPHTWWGAAILKDGKVVKVV